jgi:hypothetical protein
MGISNPGLELLMAGPARIVAPVTQLFQVDAASRRLLRRSRATDPRTS